MSGIGNKKEGFTLLEVIAATAILSLGIVFIYQAFFTSLDTFSYCANYLDVGSWSNEKIWEVQNKIKCFGPSVPIETTGSFTKRNRNFEWGLSYGLIDMAADLYEINLAVLQQEGKRRVVLVRTAYVVYEE
jgi:prepilin-type N-terminal cleavage/methylation domain-containing protein